MNETLHTAEETNPTREQVIDALKQLVNRGYTHPDTLPLDDPGVIAVQALLDAWTNQQSAVAQEAGTLEADLEFRLSRSTLFIDAGFSDKDYLDEVANEWLIQDLHDAEEAGLIEMAVKIQERIKEIETRLSK